MRGCRDASSHLGASTLNPWHHDFVPKSSSKDRDFVTVARRVVEHAIGEHLDGTPLEKEVDERSPRAVKAGQLGGLKGGKARAKKLSSSRRRAIARKAAATRWKSEN